MDEVIILLVLKQYLLFIWRHFFWVVNFVHKLRSVILQI